MTIEKTLVTKNVAVRVSIQSIDLNTHAKMQSLNGEDVAKLKERCDIIVHQIDDLVGHVQIAGA